jgi:hypothetical protein
MACPSLGSLDFLDHEKRRGGLLFRTIQRAYAAKMFSAARLFSDPAKSSRAHGGVRLRAAAWSHPQPGTAKGGILPHALLSTIVVKSSYGASIGVALLTTRCAS